MKYPAADTTVRTITAVPQGRTEQGNLFNQPVQFDIIGWPQPYTFDFSIFTTVTGHRVLAWTATIR